MSTTFVPLSVILSLCYCYFLSSKFPKGIPRFISLLPIFYLFTILPLYHSSAFITAVSTFFITWLANFKLLLFAFDQGPLSKNGTNPNSLSLPIFIFMAAFPLRTKQDSFTSNPTKKIPLNLAAEIPLLAFFFELVFHHRTEIHPKSVIICYCFMLFLMIDILVALSSSIVKLLVGLELEPPSNEPYLSTSLQDFWGKRWNLTVTNTLRHTVYIPVKSTLWSVVGKEWAPRVAMLATFLVSGLMHELLFYYVTRVSPSWEMTWFFVIHGVCVMVEIGVKRAVKDTWRLPWVVSGPLTVGFVVVTAFGLFYPPIMRNGADERVLQEIGTCFDWFKQKLPTLVARFKA